MSGGYRATFRCSILASRCLPACCRRPRCSHRQAYAKSAIDWATYNPVSLVLKDKGLLEKESPRTASPSAGRCVQQGGANGRLSISDRTGSAALVAKINGNRTG